MLPPAPCLFSTTTDWPQTSCRRLETRRAVISVEPPGVNGTTTRTDLTGQLALKARRDETIHGAVTAAVARPTKWRRFSMGTSSECDRPIVPGHEVFLAVWGQTPAKSIRVFVVIFGCRDGVGIRQPAVQVDVAAALGTKRPRSFDG